MILQKNGTQVSLVYTERPVVFGYEIFSYDFVEMRMCAQLRVIRTAVT
jgi:hypothetical protein